MRRGQTYCYIMFWQIIFDNYKWDEVLKLKEIADDYRRAWSNQADCLPR